MYDIAVIGAGPAGVSAAIYGASRGKTVLVLEQEAVGGVIGKVSTVTHYAGILESETGGSFAARLKRQTEKSGVKLVYERVTGVRLKGEVKKIFTEGHVYEAGRVILANGTTPNRLNIPGEEELIGLGMNMNAARDGRQYRGRHVYVVGGADGAVKEAIYLSGLAEKVTVLHFEETLGAISEFQQKVKAAGNIEVKLHTRLTAVAGKGRIEKLELTDVRDGSTVWREDPGCGIFVYAGAAPNTELYPELELAEGYIPVNDKMETELPGVYAVGDIRVKQVRQAATAVADGAIAAINAALF